MSAPVPTGYATVNPFLISRDAVALMEFVQAVFGGTEHADARTTDTDGLLLHAELEIGGSTLMFADRKPGWPYTPSLLQIYVDDVRAVLERARARGGEVVTEPIDFYGTEFSRLLDPWRNLWWVYRHGEPTSDWSPDGAGSDWSADQTPDGDTEETWDADSAELRYIHETLVATFPRLRE